MRSMSMKVCFYREGWVTCTLRLKDGTSGDLMPVMITSDGWYSWMTCGKVLRNAEIFSTIIAFSLYCEYQRFFSLCIIRFKFFPHIFFTPKYLCFLLCWHGQYHFLWWKMGDKFMRVLKRIKSILFNAFNLTEL